MSALPSGTITFLFTDVQDSTRLWEKYPADMRLALKRHDEIIESVSQQHHGFVVRPRGEGDSRFIVFERAIDGVSAAAAIQRALHAELWPEQTPLYVRMSLHTGEGEFREGDYYGTAVNRCARLRGIAHGGQTVISKKTYQLSMQELSQLDEFIDLGEHPLKGMQEPEHVYQLTGTGLPREFPALKSPDDVEEPPAPGKPPFKGLQHFDEADAALFFGREMLTDKIIARLQDSISPGTDRDNFLALIVGASGSGKSSLVRAGMIPAIKESENWPVHVITPGDHPLLALANNLAQDAKKDYNVLIREMLDDPKGLHQIVCDMISNGAGELGGMADISPQPPSPPAPSHVLLVVDQFEEVFTLCRDEIERRAFIDNLLTAASPNFAGPTLVVIVLRADFYGHCGGYANLREALANSQEFIGPMTQEELQRAIEEPARQGDWEFEPGLVDMLLQEVGDEPGALPLLSHALLETWKRRRGRMMTFTGYAESGGIRGAIAKTAEWVYWRMSPEEQTITRNLFLRLTELGEGTDEGGMPSPDTRRRVLLTELMPDIENAPEARAATEEVLQTLVDARLITAAEETAEVAHEALIREWPTLREWLNEDREGLLLHRHLTETSQEWQRLERTPSELYRGKRLTQVLEWSWDHRNELNALEKEFLDASLADRRDRQAAEEERQAKEAALEARSRRFLRALVGVFAIATIIAVILSIFAFNQRGIAQDNALIAGQNAATATVAQGLAQYQAATAVAAKDEAEFQAERADAAAAEALAQKAVAEQEARAALEAYSLSLAANAQESLNDLDSATALVLAQAANDIDDPPELAQQILLEAAYSPGARARYSISDTFEGVGESVWGLDIGPDDRTALLGFEDGSLILWDMETGKEVRRFEGHKTLINDVAFRPDGLTALSASEDTRVIYWDVSTGREIHRLEGHAGHVRTVAFSPNGNTAISGGYIGDSHFNQGELILWDLETGQEIRRFEGHTNGVLEVAFTPDGSKAASVSGPFSFEGLDAVNEIFIWDVQTGEALHHIETPDHDNNNLEISPDGSTLITLSADTADFYFWDIQSGDQIDTLEAEGDFVWTMTASQDGRWALMGSGNGEIHLWDLWTRQQAALFNIHGIGTKSLAISPDGRRAISSALDGTLIIWDLVSAAETQRFTGHTAPFIMSLEFTPDGKYFVSSSGRAVPGMPISEDNTLRLWDLENGQQIQIFEGHTDGIWSVAISPDGERLLSGGIDQSVRLWDLATGEQILLLEGHEGWVIEVVFTPDGNRALSGGLDGNLILWDLETGEIIRYLDSDLMDTWSLAITSDNKKALSAGNDCVVGMWDLETGEQALRFERHLVEGNAFCAIAGIVITSDGRSAITAGTNGTMIQWDLESGEEIQQFEGLPGAQPRLNIDADGNTLFSSAGDGTLTLWDINTGTPIRVFRAPDIGWTLDSAISHDGKTGLTAVNNSIIQWDLEIPTLDELKDWIQANRYARELTCEERDLYRIGSCEE